jgi:uncharacterized protein (TIGR00369 family)
VGPATNRALLELIVRSPLGALLDLQIEESLPDSVRIRLPFRKEVTTVGELIHGGAISALVDTAATAVAWADVEDPASARGTTVGFSLQFLAGARGQDVIATGRVTRRGRSLTFCEVDVAGADGAPVAKALVTYKLDRP